MHQVGQPLSSGPRTLSRWGAPITNANTNRFFMAGKMAVSTFGVARETKAMCGTSRNTIKMIYTPR